MSDFNISADCSDSYRSILMTTPFHPKVKQIEKNKWEATFNQGYVFDYLGVSSLNDPIVIDGMNEAFTLANEEGDPQYKTTNYYVRIEVDTSNGSIYYAEFEQYTDDQDPPLSSDTLNIDGGEQTTVTQYIKVASFTEQFIKNLYLRDNIHWWGKKIIQENNAIESVGHPINIDTGSTGQGASRPLAIKTISGYGETDYKIVDVFDGKSDNIIVSGITGYGVMYGDGAAGQETYEFLDYPEGVAQSANDSTESNGWEHRLVAADDPPSAPAWAERQYLPQVAEGAAQGDILYYNATEQQWVVLAAPDPLDFQGDPVLQHDGTAPYWGQDDYDLPMVD